MVRHLCYTRPTRLWNCANGRPYWKRHADSRYLGRNRCFGVLRWATRSAWARHQRSLDQQPDGAGALPADLHWADASVSGSGVPQALSCTAGVRTREILREPGNRQASAHRLLDRERSAARSACGAFGGPLALPIGEFLTRILAAIAALIVTLATPVFAGSPQTVVLDVQNMTCSLCPITVKKSLQRVAGVMDAKVDLGKKTATVTFDPD